MVKHPEMDAQDEKLLPQQVYDGLTFTLIKK